MPMRGTMASSDSTTGFGAAQSCWSARQAYVRAGAKQMRALQRLLRYVQQRAVRVKGVAYAVVLGWRHGGAKGAVGVDDGARYV